MVGFNVEPHSCEVVLETFTSPRYRQHLFFNLGISLLRLRKGSRDVRNGLQLPIWLPLSENCTKAIQYKDVSAYTTISFIGSYLAKTSLELRASLVSLNARCWLSPQINVFFKLSRSRRDFVHSARPGENLLS